MLVCLCGGTDQIRVTDQGADVSTCGAEQIRVLLMCGGTDQGIAVCGGTDQGIADVSGGTDQGIADVSMWGNRSGYC